MILANWVPKRSSHLCFHVLKWWYNASLWVNAISKPSRYGKPMSWCGLMLSCSCLDMTVVEIKLTFNTCYVNSFEYSIEKLRVFWLKWWVEWSKVSHFVNKYDAAIHELRCCTATVCLQSMQSMSAVQMGTSRVDNCWLLHVILQCYNVVGCSVQALIGFYHKLVSRALNV